MTTLTFELPDNLSQQLTTKGISHHNLEQMFLRMVQSVVKQSDKATLPETIKPPPESTVYLYPTIAVPLSSLDGLIGIMPSGITGDALADTEALYDEV